MSYGLTPMIKHTRIDTVQNVSVTPVNGLFCEMLTAAE